MTDPILLQRLQAILPGEWTAAPQGYSLATPAGALTVRTPGVQYLVRLGEGDALKTYEPADLAPLIRRVLGNEVFNAITDPTNTVAAKRSRRAELNKARQDAEAVFRQAQDALTAIEAEIADFDRETTS